MNFLIGKIMPTLHHFFSLHNGEIFLERCRNEILSAIPEEMKSFDHEKSSARSSLDAEFQSYC